MIKVEFSVVAYPDSNPPEPAVLLQLPEGFIILRPDEARDVAAELTLMAERADEAGRA